MDRSIAENATQEKTAHCRRRFRKICSNKKSLEQPDKNCGNNQYLNRRIQCFFQFPPTNFPAHLVLPLNVPHRAIVPYSSYHKTERLQYYRFREQKNALNMQGVLVFA